MNQKFCWHSFLLGRNTVDEQKKTLKSVAVMCGFNSHSGDLGDLSFFITDGKSGSVDFMDGTVRPPDAIVCFVRN